MTEIDENPLYELYADTRSLDEFIIVWFSASNEENRDELVNMFREKLDTVMVFNTSDDCIDYTTNIQCEKIMFIIPYSISETLVPLIHDLSPIIAIYILNFTGENGGLQWKTDYSKVVDTFYNYKTLFDKIMRDVTFGDQSQTPLKLYKSSEQTSTHDLMKDNVGFIWFQLLIGVLFRFDKRTRPHWKEIMLCLCRYSLLRNCNELKKIHEFETSYTSEQAVWWYTRDSFICRLINRALRTENIDCIIPYQFFITDLHNQLRLMHEQFIRLGIENLIVYRGQSISAKELELLKNNVNGLVSMNTFTSTSTNREVAIMYAGDGRSILGESVLFEIHIKSAVQSKYPFADISNVSFFRDEGEVLFTMGSVFRIISVVKEVNNIWIIQLHLNDQDDKELNDVMQYYQEKIGPRTDITSFCDVMLEMGEFEKAHRYVNLTGIASARMETTYHNLALVYFAKEKYSLALSTCMKVVEMKERSNLHYNTKHGTYHLLAQIYCGSGNLTEAITYANKALDLLNINLSEDHEYISSVHSTLAYIYMLQGNLNEALKSFEQALKLSETLPEYHPIRGNIHTAVGLCHNNNGNCSLALMHYEIALPILLKTLPSNHGEIACLYNNIGLAYYGLKDFEDALFYYEKAAEVYSKSALNQTKLAITWSNLGLLFCAKKNYTKALIYYEKALHIQQQTLPDDHFQLAFTYHNIGGVHLEQVTSASKDMETLKLALSYHEKALNIASQTLLPNHGMLIECRETLDYERSLLHLFEVRLTRR